MTDAQAILYCVNHPSVETSLRCNNCDRPICAKCAVLTPTGYRCKDCVRSQQKVFDTAVWYDFPLGFGVAAILSYLGSLLIPIVGFFTIFLAPVAGVAIAEAVRRTIHRRRSKSLFATAAAGAALGGLLRLLGPLLGVFFGAGAHWIDLIWFGFYTITITSTVYYRLKGINIR
jgi:hypothetical protein